MPSDAPKWTPGPAEFQRAQATMGLIGRLADSVDWDAYVATVDRAETIGPIIDPTLYKNSPHDLRRETTELARLMAKVVKQWEKCNAELDPARPKPLQTGDDAEAAGRAEYDRITKEKQS